MVKICFYTDTVQYFFLKLNVRTLDNCKKKTVHHFHNMFSPQKKGS